MAAAPAPSLQEIVRGEPRRSARPRGLEAELSDAERPQLLDHWRERGLVDAQGRVVERWRTIVETAFR